MTNLEILAMIANTWTLIMVVVIWVVQTRTERLHEKHVRSWKARYAREHFRTHESNLNPNCMQCVLAEIFIKEEEDER